jgi:hypothetical protein
MFQMTFTSEFDIPAVQLFFLDSKMTSSLLGWKATQTTPSE